ncbi:ATP-binding protein [Micromonosporaceae bacterium Da 78-11]
MNPVPHASAVELHSWKLDSFTELRLLRAALREAVLESPVVNSPDVDIDDIFDRMAVVATELATNALRHGLPPTVVRLLREDDHLILDVADHDLQAGPHLDLDRPLGAGGLGLQLTKTFALDVGWYYTEVTKHVWASFPG